MPALSTSTCLARGVELRLQQAARRPCPSSTPQPSATEPPSMRMRRVPGGWRLARRHRRAGPRHWCGCPPTAARHGVGTCSWPRRGSGLGDFQLARIAPHLDVVVLHRCVLETHDASAAANDSASAIAKLKVAKRKGFSRPGCVITLPFDPAWSRAAAMAPKPTRTSPPIFGGVGRDITGANPGAAGTSWTALQARGFARAHAARRHVLPRGRQRSRLSAFTRAATRAASEACG